MLTELYREEKREEGDRGDQDDKGGFLSSSKGVKDPLEFPEVNSHEVTHEHICFLGQRQKTIYHSCISALYINSGLLSWLSGKEFTCQARDTGLIPGLRRSSEEGNGKPLQYSCLENPMYRRTWKASVHGVSKSQTVLCE